MVHPLYDLALHSEEMLRMPIYGLVENEALQQWIDLGALLFARGEPDLIAGLMAARRVTLLRAARDPRRIRRARRRARAAQRAADAAAVPTPAAPKRATRRAR